MLSNLFETNDVEEQHILIAAIRLSQALVPLTLRFSLAGVCALIAGQAQALAQQAVTPAMLTSALPNAPDPVAGPQASQGNGAANISGAVADQGGAAVVGAHIVVLDENGRTLSETHSDAAGKFSVQGLGVGSTIQVAVSAPGFASWVSQSIAFTETHLSADLPVTLALSVESTEINVSANAIAAEQVKAAEKQRVLGVIPNFYTSYIYDAVPLSTKQKYSLALRATFDPISFVITGIVAGAEQANNSYKGYGQGAAGYGKRYAAAYGDGLFSDIFSHAVYPSLFHQDPRYFYQGSGTFKSRFVHAISYGFVLRSDSGSTVPNYSYLAGDLTAGAISNLYYPHADRGAGLVFSGAAIGIAGHAGEGLIREFVLSYFTTNKAGKGKSSPTP